MDLFQPRKQELYKSLAVRNNAIQTLVDRGFRISEGIFKLSLEDFEKIREKELHHIFFSELVNIDGSEYKDGGVLLASYLFGGRSNNFSKMNINEKIEYALATGEHIHPGNYRENFNGKAAGIIWQDEKYNKSGWSSWQGDSIKKLPVILKGENRMLFAGDCISPRLSGWLAGAIEGAWLTIAELDKRAAQI